MSEPSAFRRAIGTFAVAVIGGAAGAGVVIAFWVWCYTHGL